jgi:hypothetical protein
VLIAPPSTVADIVTRAKRHDDGTISEDGRVAVPAAAPAFVMTIENAESLRDSIDWAIVQAEAERHCDRKKAEAEKNGVCWFCDGAGEYNPGHSITNEFCDECDGTGVHRSENEVMP